MGSSCWVTFFKEKCKSMDFGGKKLLSFFKKKL